jgi:hypothetical protein
VLEGGLMIARDECTRKIKGGTKTKTIPDAFRNIRELFETTVRATSDNRNKQKAKGNLRYIYVMNEYVHT